jgi:hypothetical protein
VLLLNCVRHALRSEKIHLSFFFFSQSLIKSVSEREVTRNKINKQETRTFIPYSHEHTVVSGRKDKYFPKRMNYVKSFWSSVPPATSGAEVVHSQPSAIAAPPASYNSVTFTTTSSAANSKIIITTVPQSSSQQIVYHNEKKHRLHEMATSPSDSFHSASSTLEHPNNGKVNMGYSGSSSEINNNNGNGVTRHPHNQ